MKITTQWTFGNFKISAATEVETAEPVGGTAQMLMEAGFLQILQRVPSSNAEKHVAGYEKRPEKFQRSSIAYSDETALKLIEGFGTQVNVGSKDEPNIFKYVITDVSEHEGSDGVSARKMATEMWSKVAGTPMEAALGLKGDVIIDEQGIEACHKFLATLRAKPVKKG